MRVSPLIAILTTACLTSAYYNDHYARSAYEEGYEAGLLHAKDQMLHGRESYDNIYGRDASTDADYEVDSLYMREAESEQEFYNDIYSREAEPESEPEVDSDYYNENYSRDLDTRGLFGSKSSKLTGRCDWQAGIMGPRHGQTFRCIVPGGICTSCDEKKHKVGQSCNC